MRDLLKDNTVKEKIPYDPPVSPTGRTVDTSPPLQNVGPGETETSREIKQKFRQRPQPPAPIHTRKTDTSSIRLVDHTVEIDGEIGCGYLVRDHGADIGFVWCIQTAWKYCTMDKQTTGSANTKRAATEALQEIKSQSAGAQGRKI